MSGWPAGRTSSAERGSVLVMVALWMPLVVLMLSLVVNVGHWFEHKRHLQLQADAAVLAGGDRFGACFNNGGGDNALFSEATKYAGSVASFGGSQLSFTPLYNSQVGGNQKGPVSILYQSDRYVNDKVSRNDGTETVGPCETTSLMFDVKATESSLPWFMGGGKVVSAVNAHARVQLRALHDTSPSLPLAVPDISPKQVGVTFVNEVTGAALSGCSGASHVTGTPCTFLLAKGTPANGLNMWSGSETVTLPAAPAKVGVRVGIGGQVGTCANINGTGSYFCYDGSSTTAGLTMIRDYAVGAVPGPPPTQPPVLDGVWPTSCSGNGAFFFITTGTCAGGVTAEVNYGTGSTQPNANFHIRATVGGTTAELAPVSYDNARNAWIWATSAITPPFPLGAQAGAQGISLAWEVNDTSLTIAGNNCTTGGGNKCKGNFANAPQQRFYSGLDDSSGSGPIRLLQLNGGGDANGPASLVPGSYTLTVTVGVAGSYQVNTACTGPGAGSGKTYTCATDPAVPIRLKAANGNTTFAVDCGGPSNVTGANLLAWEIENGCLNRFSLNSLGVCPDPANPDPPDCAPVNAVGSGLKTGPVRTAMNNRFAPNGTCLSNNYPTVTPDDKRVVILMITDFSAFNSNGSNVLVPVITYGAFYVTGWDGADPSCNTQNDAPPGGTSDTGEIWGHFITYVNVGGTGGTAVCDPSGLLPCVPVLTQ